MCGIAGLINLDERPIDGATLKLMTEAQSHRGPDATAVWIRGRGTEIRRQRTVRRDEPDLLTATSKTPILAPCIGLGQTRLRIIDVEGGDPPIWNEDRSSLIVFNGEIYNFRELRVQLESSGHHFRSSTDTEVILHAYEEWGEACPDHLRGMFAFAIWSERRRELFLARDRMGIKPLHLAWSRERLAFSSELKALLQDPDLDRSVDLAGLDAYLSLGYVPGPGTILRSVTTLPAGHSLTLRVGEAVPEYHRYWQVPLGVVRPRSEAECLAELDDLLRDVVGRHLISDVPLGVFLSGGIDSSVIVAVAAALAATPLQTFSIGFPGSDGYNEAPFAAEVARRFGTEHRQCLLEPNALEVLPELTCHLDQPLADPSAIPLYHLCRMTREHVTVVLAGDGGDELFGGYERYYWDRVATRYSRLPAAFRTGLIEPAVFRLPHLPLDVRRDPLRRARKFVKHAALPASERYFNWFELMTPEFRHELFSAGRNSTFDPWGEPGAGSRTFPYPGRASRYFERAFEEARAQGASPLATMQYCDTQTMLRDDLLLKCDRVSMAVALEARVPLLDHVLVEWAFRLPDNLKVRGRTLKYLLKRWLARHLPREVIYRRKQGFEVPLYGWLTGSGSRRTGGALSSEWVRDLLLGPGAAAGGIFHPEGIRRLVERLEDGERSLALPVYSLLAWELWRREVLGTTVVAAGV
jgi:asparagine synthase (glutamine-hydrolysing)